MSHNLDSAADAILNRAITGMLAAAESGSERNFQFFQGKAAAAQMLRHPLFRTLLDRDLQNDGYVVPQCLEAAFASVRGNAEHITFAEVQQLVAAIPTQLTADPVTNIQIDAGHQLKHREGVVIDADPKKAPAAADADDGSSEHGLIVLPEAP